MRLKTGLGVVGQMMEKAIESPCYCCAWCLDGMFCCSCSERLVIHKSVGPMGAEAKRVTLIAKSVVTSPTQSPCPASKCRSWLGLDEKGWNKVALEKAVDWDVRFRGCDYVTRVSLKHAVEILWLGGISTRSLTKLA